MVVLNAYAERFVLSIESECLDRLVLVGEKQLRTAVREYLAHDHTERPHQGLAGEVIESATNDNADGSIQCNERLGSLLHCYHRNAA